MDKLYIDSRMVSFNDGWSFIEPGGEAAVCVQLPHSWNAVGWTYEDEKNDQPSGIGIYEKHIDKEDIQDYEIRFEGVCAYCEVFINGTKIAENIGAYKPFNVSPDYLSDGENIITVKVTDKKSLKLLKPGCDDTFSKSPRYKLWPVGYGSTIEAGGIWRDVYKVRKMNTFMEPFNVRPNGKSFDISANFVGNTEGYNVRYTLFDDNEKTELLIKADCRDFSVTPKNPVLSWPLKPHLYTLKAELINSDGVIEQTICQPVSLMSFSVRNSEFKINSKPYFLRGQNGFPHCNVAHDKEYIEKYVNAVVKQGVEISRFHTEPPSHAWLDECDRQGVMVVFEMPLHGSFGCYSFCSEEFVHNTLSEILALVKEYRRHTCIVMWSMGNEMIVSCERDLGLGRPLFDVLQGWIAEVRKLDLRPIIANSNGDAANLITKSVGDVDCIHQYGGWYVETLFDLRHFGDFTRKDDMLFQPCISMESIAGYTNENEEFFCKHTDVRQRKVVKMRLGEITDLREQSRKYQAFMLKEYAEAMWRLRNDKSSFAGYIPFGQYTWFFKPFCKDGIIPKSIWETYRNVMSAIHIQIECFSRHLERGGYISGRLGVWNEDINLHNPAMLEIVVSSGSKTFLKRTVSVPYHKSNIFDVKIGPLYDTGELKLEVFCAGKRLVKNSLGYTVYEVPEFKAADSIYVYDPEYMLNIGGTRVQSLKNISKTDCKTLLVGPYALDCVSESASKEISDWIYGGGHVIVLEQTPGFQSENMFGTGVSSVKVAQPQWSRWAMNLVKHADRSDICNKKHRMFDGLTEGDLFWWNGDTYLANSYLNVEEENKDDVIISRIGNGLSSGELMPERYKYRDTGYSITAVERKIGKGSALFTSLLIGSKSESEPVAEIILRNLLCKDAE